MKACFYRLHHRSDAEPYAVYGRPEWERRFGRAEWSDKVADLDIGRFSLIISSPAVDLVVVLPSPDIGDFVWTWYSDCIVTDHTLFLFRQAGFTGFEVRPVTVERVKRVSRKRHRELVLPSLWELRITGKGGDADRESGIRVIDRVEDSGILLYSSFRNGIIVDEANWDGSDFCTVNGYPKYILVSERVKEFIIGHRLTNCALIPSHKLEWKSGIRPEESLERRRALASRDLASLLADLEGDDASCFMKTIHALGEKGDPAAVSSLIKKFAHPDPLIWQSVASAVANIAGRRDTSDEVRDEIVSRLSVLLGHINPMVRKSAASALGFIGGKHAAELIVPLLADANDSVRSNAVFVLGYMRYAPAQKAVKRLTRDHSKTVRVTARMVLPQLSGRTVDAD